MLVLVRHGESTANAAGLLLGRTDADLTERGRHQAVAARALLGPVREVTSSPLRRALDTAALLAGERPVEVDGRWVEVDYGEYEGWSLGAVPADVWRRWRSDPDFRPLGGETLGEVGTRVRQACRQLFAEEGQGARDPEGDRVVVSHVSPIKAAVAWALGADDGLAWRLHLSTASVTRIGWGPDGPVVHAFNVTPPS
jgi:broad specificity phosphatase PhoE